MRTEQSTEKTDPIETREIVIRYQLGHEEDAQVVSMGNTRRCMEDTVAAAYGIGRLVEGATRCDEIETPGISHNQVAESILGVLMKEIAKDAYKNLVKLIRGE